MRVLSLDIGNSKGAVALVENGRVTASLRREHRRDAPEDSLRALHRWCGERVGESAVEGIVVASVVPELLVSWLSLWQQSEATCAFTPQVVTAETPFPFAVDIEDPTGVGADRWCNLAAAAARGYESALVVDLGTANTYDLLLAGHFRGGLIAPGLVTSLRALSRESSLLPEVEFTRPSHLLGGATVAAIEAGAWYQGVLGVRAVIERLLFEHPQTPVLMSGGLCHRVATELPADALLAPDLTLEGAAALLRVPGTRRS